MTAPHGHRHGGSLRLGEAQLLCALRRRVTAKSAILGRDLNISAPAVRSRIRTLRPRLELCRISGGHGRDGYRLEMIDD